MIGAWGTHDGRLELAVIKLPLPFGYDVDLAETSLSLAREFGDRMIDSTVEERGDYSYYRISAQGMTDGEILYVCLVSTKHDNVVYAALACGIRRDPLNDADAQSFLRTFSVNGS